MLDQNYEMKNKTNFSRPTFTSIQQSAPQHSVTWKECKDACASLRADEHNLFCM